MTEYLLKTALHHNPNKTPSWLHTPSHTVCFSESCRTIKELYSIVAVCSCSLFFFRRESALLLIAIVCGTITKFGGV